MCKWIICVGPDWYRPSVTSTKQFVRQFKKNGYNVLWVNPIAFKSPFVNSTTKSSAWRKIKNKIRTHLRGFQRIESGFWVLVPFYFPSFNSKSEIFNRKIVVCQVRLCSLFLGISWKNSILWTSGSFTAEGLLAKSFFRKVYQAADLISEFRDASPELRLNLQNRERNLCNQADVVFAASETIQKKLIELCKVPEKIHVLHHGVDFSHFSNPRELAAPIQKIKAKGNPIAGYFGSLSDANDKNVFLELANHGFSVVIIGKILGDYTKLQTHKNIHFLGTIPYSVLPTYAKGFNIALLNWRMHDWIKNSFPIKALEYLALGLPVVSCKIPVLMNHFSDEIIFAETAQEFVLAAQQCIKTDSEIAQKKRQDIVQSWSWEERFKSVRLILEI